MPVDGIVLTKLDGTAKGGIALAIAGELDIPVKLIGIGEALEDLRPFDADDFARALVADPETVVRRPAVCNRCCTDYESDREVEMDAWMSLADRGLRLRRRGDALHGLLPRPVRARRVRGRDRRADRRRARDHGRDLRRRHDRCTFLLLRPIAKRHITQPAELRTGTAALVGQDRRWCWNGSPTTRASGVVQDRRRGLDRARLRRGQRHRRGHSGCKWSRSRGATALVSE